MGHVQIDTSKKERQYLNMTLSDYVVVKYLLLYRSKVDVNYGADTNININEAGDMFEFNQELICLYASLDEVIDKIEFSEKEEKLLKLVFEGNTLADMKSYGFPRRTPYDIFKRIVKKIVNQNNRDWKGVMREKGYIKS